MLVWWLHPIRWWRRRRIQRAIDAELELQSWRASLSFFRLAGAIDGGYLGEQLEEEKAERARAVERVAAMRRMLGQ